MPSSKPNPLLKAAIDAHVDQVRYVEPAKRQQKRPVFYVLIICLVTLAVLLSLLRYL